MPLAYRALTWDRGRRGRRGPVVHRTVMRIKWALSLAVTTSLASGCWLPIARDDGDQCQDEVLSLGKGGTFVSKDTGEHIEVETLLSKVEGSWSGTLRWIQTGAASEATLSLRALPDPSVTVYWLCDEPGGVDIPAHLDFVTSDGVCDAGYTGNVTLDSSYRVRSDDLLLPLEVDAEALPQAITPDLEAMLVNAPAPFHLALHPDETHAAPFSQATVILAVPPLAATDRGPHTVTLGQVQFDARVPVEVIEPP